MSDLAFSTDELLDLANGLCNETLGTVERARLEQLLTASAAARAVFADYMFLHSELYWTCAAPGAIDGTTGGSGELLPPAVRVVPDTQPGETAAPAAFPRPPPRP